MGISIWQVLIVAVVVLLLFGAGRVPRLMGDMAKGIKSFKQGMKDDVPTDEPAARPASDPDRLEAQARAAADAEKDRAKNG